MRALGEFPFVAAVRTALPWSALALGVAFVAIVIAAPPAAATLGMRLALALLPAFGAMAGALVVLLALFLAKRADQAAPALLIGSGGAFLLALPQPFGPNAIAYLRALGTSGLFLAILACGVTYAAACVARRRMPKAAAGWVGAVGALAIFAALRGLHVSLPGLIALALVPLAHLGDTYVALIVIVLIEMLLWTAGVHGPAVLAAAVTPVYLTMQMQNAQAFGAHHSLPYIVVVSLFLFVFPGGSGATLPLAIMFARSRVPRLRKLGRITLLPALFNINEPLLFGAPVVFNPYLAVPFVIAPLVLATFTYAVVAEGWVARAAFYVPSSIPSVVSVYLATQDVRAIGLVLANVVLAGAIYYPFVRAYERHVSA